MISRSSTPANGQRLAYPGNTDLWKWTNIPGFNKSKFAWTSSQPLNANYPPQRAGAVELQLDRDGNTYAELAASQSGTAIYQKIATTPGVAYTVRLSHASQSAATGTDRLQVLIGPPGPRTAGGDDLDHLQQGRRQDRRNVHRGRHMRDEHGGQRRRRRA
ncbi:hypothetical protein MCC01979_18600 [Bifidobacteriaceae bacterium MCC01979]|nr:hypothetical protein MCC01983_06760 [Bifidobacteriaceae bacterium MCC01983]GDZ55010.1 hypothetical protein MCC01979_18600 [Bifidobacteriaceae bacterium MCC01979]